MKRLTTRLANSTPKTRLDDYLAQWIPTAIGKPLPKSKVRTLILSGAVYVNRHRNKIPSTEIFAGAVLEVYFDESKLALSEHPAHVAVPLLKNEHILFEDEWLIVVNKEPGIPTQPTIDPNRPNLFDLTKKFLSRRDGKESYVGLHHRLDRDTSGIVLFTKKEEVNKGVADLFTQHQIQKTYHALAWKAQPSSFDRHQEFEVKNFLGKISEKSEKSRFGSVKSGGDPAHTFFRVLEVFRNAYWMEAKPKTGRTHQIRVHLSEMGLPILGDPLYFPKNVFAMVTVPRLMLHAYQLDFVHPMTQKPIKIEAPLPDDFFKALGSLKS